MGTSGSNSSPTVSVLLTVLSLTLGILVYLARRSLLLSDLGDLERLRLLSRVRVLRTGVHLQLGEQLPAETVLRQHAPDSLLDGLARVLLEDLADRRGRQTTRVARVAVRQLVGPLVAGQGDLGGVDDDDEVTAVHVRRERRLVLAAQQGGDLDGEPTEHDVGGVDHMPLTGDVSRFRAVRAHGR